MPAYALRQLEPQGIPQETRIREIPARLCEELDTLVLNQ